MVHHFVLVLALLGVVRDDADIRTSGVTLTTRPVVAARRPGDIAREEAQIQAEYDQLEQEHSELLALRIAMMRLAATTADLERAGLEADLITEKRQDDGSLEVNVSPLYYEKRPIQLQVFREDVPTKFRVRIVWADTSRQLAVHDMTVRLDVVQRLATVGEGGDSVPPLQATDFRLVFPTRPQLFVTWPNLGHCELLMWDGYARFRIDLSADGTTGQPVVDGPAQLPPHLQPVANLTTLLPTTDDRVILLIRNPLFGANQLREYDRQALAGLSGWGSNPFGASNDLQLGILRNLSELEAVDEAHLHADANSPTSLTALQERRTKAVQELEGQLHRLNDATAERVRQRDVLREKVEALRHERISRLQALWLHESGALNVLGESHEIPPNQKP